jgi:hypothetical protein
VGELAELYAVLLVLYLFECLAWVPRRAFAFFALAGGWRARAAFRPNASWASSVAVGMPWPPLTPGFVAEPLPFAVDPKGIVLTESDGRRLAWQDLDPIVARGLHIESGSHLSWKLASRGAAAGLAEALEKVRVAKPSQRENGLRRLLDARFDGKSASARYQEFAAGVRLLRVVSNALWVALFGGLGVAVLAQNMLFLLAAAGLTLLVWPINAAIFARTLRKQKWLPRAHWPELHSRVVAMLSPLSSIRAVDGMAREMWANLDPLVVAATLLSRKDLSAFARPRVVDMQSRPDDDLDWWRTEIRLRIERVLAAREIAVADLLAPPLREGGHVAWYCPACLAQYEQRHDLPSTCPNEGCQGIALRAFAGEGASGAMPQGES